MADELLTPATRPTLWERAADLPVPVRIGILYLLARAVTTVFFVMAAQLAPLASRFGADPSPGTFAAGWDAWWYWFVASYGYPDVLPLTDAGDVAENAWAFMPVYAYCLAGVGLVVGSWIAGAVVVSMVAGYLACLVLHRMIRMRASDGVATWAVVFFAAGPLAALFQVGYAESLFLLWLFLALWCVMRRSLRLAVPPHPAHGIHSARGARVRALPRAARHPSLVHAGTRAAACPGRRPYRRARRARDGRRDSHGRPSRLSGRATPAPICRPNSPGAATGSSILLRSSCRSTASSSARASGRVNGAFPRLRGTLLLAALILAVIALLIFEPHVKRLGADLRLWSASYLLYLLAVFFPQSSIFRLLVPLSPLWGAVAMPKSTRVAHRRAGRVPARAVVVDLHDVCPGGYGPLDHPLMQAMRAIRGRRRGIDL